jgi:hypothetical protein
LPLIQPIEVSRTEHPGLLQTLEPKAAANLLELLNKYSNKERTD